MTTEPDRRGRRAQMFALLSDGAPANGVVLGRMLAECGFVVSVRTIQRELRTWRAASLQRSGLAERMASRERYESPVAA